MKFAMQFNTFTVAYVSRLTTSNILRLEPSHQILFQVSWKDD